jgi:hypothetical protein
MSWDIKLKNEDCPKRTVQDIKNNIAYCDDNKNMICNDKECKIRIKPDIDLPNIENVK